MVNSHLEDSVPFSDRVERASRPWWISLLGSERLVKSREESGLQDGMELKGTESRLVMLTR